MTTMVVDTPDTADLDSPWIYKRHLWTIDWRERTFSFKGVEVYATPGELKVLECLILNIGKVVTLKQMMKHIDGVGGDKIRDVYICKLRSKINALVGKNVSPVVSVWGRGTYITHPDTEAVPLQPILPKVIDLRDIFRWTPKLKEEVVLAIKKGVIDREELLNKNHITEEEFSEWSEKVKDDITEPH